MAKVLIIDRDAHLTDLLTSYLTNQGFKVFTVHSGEDGLLQALKVKPDVILMDAHMPDATGFQMCMRFREAKATQNTPIIMMSTLAHLPNQQKYAIERGANEVVAKPLKVFELGELVDKYVAFSIAKGTSSDSPKAVKEADKVEKTSSPIPAARPKYTLATDIHHQLSGWLKSALNREDNPSK